jgi:hypothetical protein
MRKRFTVQESDDGGWSVLDRGLFLREYRGFKKAKEVKQKYNKAPTKAPKPKIRRIIKGK